MYHVLSKQTYAVKYVLFSKDQSLKLQTEVVLAAFRVPSLTRAAWTQEHRRPHVYSCVPPIPNPLWLLDPWVKQSVASRFWLASDPHLGAVRAATPTQCFAGTLNNTLRHTWGVLILCSQSQINKDIETVCCGWTQMTCRALILTP